MVPKPKDQMEETGPEHGSRAGPIEIGEPVAGADGGRAGSVLCDPGQVEGRRRGVQLGGSVGQ